MGIKDLDAFNKALLAKWMWRLRSEPEGLWSRVIKLKYGGSSTLPHSVWWRGIQEACIINGENWVDEGSEKSVRSGNATSFWCENWLGGGCFREKYHRLYNLSSLKRATIAECGVWRGHVWEWKFRWRRTLRGREVGWLLSLLQDVSAINLSEGESDKWSWSPGPEGKFSVNSAYIFLQVPDSLEVDYALNLTWRSFAPSSAKAFVWRSFLDRIPSTENLLRRHVLASVEDATCKQCSARLETCSHILVSCPFAMDVWRCVFQWLGFDIVLPDGVRAHFLQFLFGGSAGQNQILCTIWVAGVWTIWLQRNEGVFRNGVRSVSAAMELIRLRAWQWITVKKKGFVYSWFEWMSNPLMCIISS